jgi:hypothetical protein
VSRRCLPRRCRGRRRCPRRGRWRSRRDHAVLDRGNVAGTPALLFATDRALSMTPWYTFTESPMMAVSPMTIRCHGRCRRSARSRRQRVSTPVRRARPRRGGAGSGRRGGSRARRVRCDREARVGGDDLVNAHQATIAWAGSGVRSGGAGATSSARRRLERAGGAEVAPGSRRTRLVGGRVTLLRQLGRAGRAAVDRSATARRNGDRSWPSRTGELFCGRVLVRDRPCPAVSPRRSWGLPWRYASWCQAGERAGGRVGR